MKKKESQWEVESAMDVLAELREALLVNGAPLSPEERKRFAAAREEIASARACGVYDVFLVNTNLDESIARAVELVKSERARRRAKRA